MVKSVSWGEMRFLTQVFIMISVLFWLTRAFAVFHHVVQYWDIKSFYNTALNIPDSSLGETSTSPQKSRKIISFFFLQSP